MSFHIIWITLYLLVLLHLLLDRLGFTLFRFLVDVVSLEVGREFLPLLGGKVTQLAIVRHISSTNHHTRFLLGFQTKNVKFSCSLFVLLNNIKDPKATFKHRKMDSQNLPPNLRNA